jgi:hypothetical protein
LLHHARAKQHALAFTHASSRQFNLKILFWRSTQFQPFHYSRVMADFSVVMSWQDDATVRTGPGISRPVPGAATAMYTLHVKPLHGQPMKVTLRAESPKHAQRYAQARWPESRVEFV